MGMLAAAAAAALGLRDINYNWGVKIKLFSFAITEEWSYFIYGGDRTLCNQVPIDFYWEKSVTILLYYNFYFL